MASKLYAYCKMRWEDGAWTMTEINIAVTKGYITEEEKTEITQLPQKVYN